MACPGARLADAGDRCAPPLVAAVIAPRSRDSDSLRLRILIDRLGFQLDSILDTVAQVEEEIPTDHPIQAVCRWLRDNP
jgi:hypothetical protein